MPFVAIKMGRRLGRDALPRVRPCAFRVMWTGHHGRAGARPYHARSRRPIFIATLRAAPSWLFFRVARSLRINLDRLVVTASPARTALENSQLTCGERHAISGTGHYRVM